MISLLLTAAAALAPAALPAATAVVPGQPLADQEAMHLGISLRLADETGVKQLIADQSNPDSPLFHQWLTPEQFGARFGLATSHYAEYVDWVSQAGFRVTPYPNRLFLEATGTVASVRRLLGVQPVWAVQSNGHVFRTYVGAPRVPEGLAADIVTMVGLDTRVLFHHYITTGQAGPAFGANGLRAFYDAAGLVSGNGGKGLQTVVIGTYDPSGLPSTGDINYYYQNVSHATATYNPVSIPNPNNDVDPQAGGDQEYELDVEMQSVGVPNADSINLLVSPSSEVFATGVQWAVNNYPKATVVSISLGLCEQGAQQNGGVTTMEQTVQQGLAEGQTWFAASGDNGADDCQPSSGAAAVDFPADLPEIVAMGGSMLTGSGSFDTSGNWQGGWASEDAWNEGQGAGGGGQSTLFKTPSYQSGISNASILNGTRGVPDLALTAAMARPGVGVDTDGTAGDIEPVGGTSVASPLAAGFFALLGAQCGGKGLGDIHQALYQLGEAQASAGSGPFHDITSGNNTMGSVTGFSAGPGYDLVTGWGTLDVARLAQVWPGCGASTTGGTTGGTTGSTTGSSAGSTTGSSTGGTTASTTGTITGSTTGSATGSSSGSATGSTTGSVTGGSGSGSGSGGRTGSGTSAGSSSGTLTGGGGSGGSGPGSSSVGSGQSPSGGESISGSGAGPLTSNAKPIPTSSGGGCSTGLGGTDLLALGLALAALMGRRRATPSRG